MVIRTTWAGLNMRIGGKRKPLYGWFPLAFWRRLPRTPVSWNDNTRGWRIVRLNWLVGLVLRTCRTQCVAALIITLASCLSPMDVAARGGIPCYYYGTEDDGHLGRPTAFASWWAPPVIPLEVRGDWLGVALAGYRPGTRVRITVMALPSWAWDELEDVVVGRSVLAVVADRPGGDYCDTWPATFRVLTGGRMWIGKVYVEIEGG